MKVDKRHKFIGGMHRALSRFYMIKNRINDQKNPKNKKYENMDFSLDKDEFVEWFTQRDYKGCSVDRIDNSKGYHMDNIQIIPTRRNIQKDKTKILDGKRWCYSCKEYKEFSEMCTSNRIECGTSTLCSKCNYARKKDYLNRKKINA